MEKDLVLDLSNCLGQLQGSTYLKLSISYNKTKKIAYVHYVP